MKTKISAELEFVLRAYAQFPKEERLQRLNEMIELEIFKDFPSEELIAVSRSSSYLSSDEEGKLLFEVALTANTTNILKCLEDTLPYERKSLFKKAVEVMTDASDLKYFEVFGKLTLQERELLFNKAIKVMTSDYYQLKKFELFGDFSLQERELLFNKAVAVMTSVDYHLEPFKIFGIFSPQEKKLLFNKAIALMDHTYQLKYFYIFGELSPGERNVLFNKAVKMLTCAYNLQQFIIFGELSPQERAFLLNKAAEVLESASNLEDFKVFGELSPQEIKILQCARKTEKEKNSQDREFNQDKHLIFCVLIILSLIILLVICFP